VVLALANNIDADSLASRMRRKRFAIFLDLCAAVWREKSDVVKIVDLGGTVEFWENHKPLVDGSGIPCEIHVVNLSPEAGHGIGVHGVRFSGGDARDCSRFGDLEFDVVFSNSVIEHVGTLHDQIGMAREIQRIGKYHFIQTPCRNFPLEPHYLFPLWVYLPMSVRSALHRRFDLGWIKAERDCLHARADVEQIRLISTWEFKKLFPGSEIKYEYFWALRKSMMAIKSPR
jgi:methyltransferase family protein